MLKASSGLMIGILLTFLAVALGNKQERKYIYRCKNKLFEACDVCCKYCGGHEDNEDHKKCSYDCGGNPKLCGQAIKVRAKR